MMRDFIKTHPYITLNAAGLLFIIPCFSCEPLATCGFMAAILSVIGFVTGIIPILFIILNIAAYSAVKKNRKDSAIAFSLLGGFLGAFIASHTVNKEFEWKTYINLAINAYVWIFVWLIVSLALFYTGKYNADLIMW